MANRFANTSIEGNHVYCWRASLLAAGVAEQGTKKRCLEKGKDKGVRGGNLDKNFHTAIDDVFKRQDGTHFSLHLVCVSGTRSSEQTCSHISFHIVTLFRIFLSPLPFHLFHHHISIFHAIFFSPFSISLSISISLSQISFLPAPLLDPPPTLNSR